MEISTFHPLGDDNDDDDNGEVMRGMTQYTQIRRYVTRNNFN